MTKAELMAENAKLKARVLELEAQLKGPRQTTRVSNSGSRTLVDLLRNQPPIEAYTGVYR